MEIRKAVRKKAKLRLGLVAPSGAGKTYSALLLAFGLNGKIGMVDTEAGSGDLYAHLGEYDIINIAAPFTIAKYREAIKAFEQAGYSTIIIDSLSHAWAGAGGLLDKQGKIADSGRGNSYTAWREVTPEHNALIDAILQSPCHIIATMRAKTEYVMEANEKGKQTPKKVGLAPVQRDGMDYEFTVVLEIDAASHTAHATKDRTSTLDGQYFTITQDTGAQLRDWLESGIEPPNPLDAMLKSISEAVTLEALRANFEAAYVMTEDAKTRSQIIAVKDERKAALLAQDEAPALPADSDDLAREAA